MTARKTLATLRAGPSKIRTEMEAVYNGDQSEKSILARLASIGYTEKSAMATYGWHYVNTSAVDGTVLAAPTFGTKRSPKPETAEVADDEAKTVALLETMYEETLAAELAEIGESLLDRDGHGQVVVDTEHHA